MSACRNIYTSLLLVLAGASNKELTRQVKYLKVENEMLRPQLGKRVVVTPASGFCRLSLPGSWQQRLSIKPLRGSAHDQP